MGAPRSIDQGYIRRYNTERLLAALEQYQPVSRTELARITEMSPGSVTRIVGALSAMGLVRESGIDGSAGRGRKAVYLRTVSDGMFTLGCHIDLQSLRLCLMDFSHHSLGTAETALKPDMLTPDRLAEIARELFLKLPLQTRIHSLGLSVSGRVDSGAGRIVESRAFGWRDADIVGPFSRALSLPVQLFNDVMACLLWESECRDFAREGRDAAYLYLGRMGVGLAHTAEGRLVHGRNNAAGEIEDVSLGLGGKLSDHLLEANLIDRARRYSPSADSFEAILDAHRMGLRWARLLMEDYLNHLDTVLDWIRALLDPQCVILGGNMPDALRAAGMLPEAEGAVPGGPFEDACAMGAALNAMQIALHNMIDG